MKNGASSLRCLGARHCAAGEFCAGATDWCIPRSDGETALCCGDCLLNGRWGQRRFRDQFFGSRPVLPGRRCEVAEPLGARTSRSSCRSPSRTSLPVHSSLGCHGVPIQLHSSALAKCASRRLGRPAAGLRFAQPPARKTWAQALAVLLKGAAGAGWRATSALTSPWRLSRTSIAAWCRAGLSWGGRRTSRLQGSLCHVLRRAPE